MEKKELNIFDKLSAYNNQTESNEHEVFIAEGDCCCCCCGDDGGSSYSSSSSFKVECKQCGRSYDPAGSGPKYCTMDGFCCRNCEMHYKIKHNLA